jgi:aminoglycoside 6'-N-acetyltransferase I
MPSTTEIKLLGAGDEAVLQTVAPTVFDDPLDVVATTTFLTDPRHHLAVALVDGVVVGFASAVHYVHPDKAAPELWINEVGVAPAHQRQGLGRQLMEALLAEARRLGCSQVWVLTERNNRAARSLYAAAGGSEAPLNLVMVEFELA